MEFKVGRPTILTPDVRKKILYAISNNLSYEHAAWHARISERTLYYWIEKGKHDEENGVESDYVQFLHDIKEAESIKITNHLNAVEEQTERWQSRSWILERRWRAHYSQDGGEIIQIKKDMEDLKEMFKSIIDPESKQKPEDL